MHKQGREGKTRLQKHETKSENVHGEGSHGQYSQHDSCILENRPSPQLGMEKKKKKRKTSQHTRDEDTRETKPKETRHMETKSKVKIKSPTLSQ